MASATPEARLLQAKLATGDAATRDRVRRVVARVGPSRAGEVLGVSRATVWRWLRRWPELRPQNSP